MNPTAQLSRKPGRALVLAGLGALPFLVAACGGGGSTNSATQTTVTSKAATDPNTTTTATTRPAGSSARGSFGPAASGSIASIAGDTLEVRSTENGQTTVNVSSKTNITATVKEALSDVKVGECVVATGTKTAAGAMSATTISISSAAGGSCTRPANRTGFGGRGGFGGNGGFGSNSGTGGGFPHGTFPGGGSRPTGTRPSFKVPANEATAYGQVTSVGTGTISVKGVLFSLAGRAFAAGQTTTSALTTTSVALSTVTLSVSTKTAYTKTQAGTISSLKVGECATAFGATNDIGAVAATRLTVSPSTSSGCSSGSGFGGRFGFGGGGSGNRGGGFPGAGGRA